MGLSDRMPGESLADYAKRLRWLHSTIELGQEQDRSVVTAWGEWLGGFEWEAWGTLTFKDPGYTHDAATRAWLRFVAAQEEGGSTHLCYFVGHEVGKLGRLHLHCLLANLNPVTARRRDLWAWWFTRYGRCGVRGYDPEKGAAHYVSKYVTKDLAHYDVELRGLRCRSDQRPHRPKRDGTRSSA